MVPLGAIVTWTHHHNNMMSMTHISWQHIQMVSMICFNFSPICPCVLWLLAKAFGLPPTSHDANQSSTIILIFIVKCYCFHYMDIVHWRVACPNFLFQHFFVFSKYPCVRTPEGIINCYLIINAINGTTCLLLLINIRFLEIDI
jgi:hypothetical protein